MTYFPSPSLTSPYYPSLSSPMTHMFTSRPSNSPKPNVFERLQEDTEKRLRTRLESFSIPRNFSLRSTTPNITSLIRQRSTSRASSRLETESELTFKPTINENSLKIFNNKYLNRAKLASNKRRMYTDEEYSGPADIEELEARTHRSYMNGNFQSNEKVQRYEGNTERNDRVFHSFPSEPTPKPQLDLPRGKKPGTGLGQQQVYTSEYEKAPVTDRKYVPMFTKPFDVSKIINKKPQNSKSHAKLTPNHPTVPQDPRPLLRPISDSTLKTEDTQVYQKIVQDRVSKLKELKKQSMKYAHK